MTVGQEIYGSGNPGSRTSLERKNVPPPLSFKFPSLTLQQHHQNNLQSPLNTIPFPKSAPAQTNNNDIMQVCVLLLDTKHPLKNSIYCREYY